MSTNHLRTGLEKLKNFYQQNLLALGHYSEQELCSLTVSELAELYRKSISTKTTPSEFSKQNSTIFQRGVRNSDIK